MPREQGCLKPAAARAHTAWQQRHDRSLRSGPPQLHQHQPFVRPTSSNLCGACRPTGLPGANPRVKLEVSLAQLGDSTMAVEVALSGALIAWPYFTETSLVGASRTARRRSRRVRQRFAPLQGVSHAAPPSLRMCRSIA